VKSPLNHVNLVAKGNGAGAGAGAGAPFLLDSTIKSF